MGGGGANAEPESSVLNSSWDFSPSLVLFCLKITSNTSVDSRMIGMCCLVQLLFGFHIKVLLP